MLAAVVRGDPAEVRLYIEDNAVDVNAAYYGLHGNTALMMACAPTEKLRVLDYLLQSPRLNKDAINRRGMTALHQAAWYGQEQAVELLLRAGADISIRTPEGLTAVNIAETMGHAGTQARIKQEKERQTHPPVETADQLRARLRAQYCQGSEDARRRQARVPPPRPLACAHANAPAPRPVLASNTHSNVLSNQEHIQVTVFQENADGSALDCGDDSFARVPSAPNQWLPSGASTANARVGKDDAAILRQKVCSQQNRDPKVAGNGSLSSKKSSRSVADVSAVGGERAGGICQEGVGSGAQRFDVCGELSTFFITEMGIGE